ncbi:MAG: ribosomal protein S18-alanine N-acetyltransferase [Ruminococcus sp.]|nr:ribosomal protein S18-alanine N-acetyltransferase [Ruminococcus sp.]
MTINKMSGANTHLVKQIEDECFSRPWSLMSIEAELNKPGSCFYVVEKDGEAVGYVGFNMVLDEGYIANLAVRENFRRNGVAKSLLSKVIDIAKENNLAFVTLEVRQSNTAAIALYSEFGFELQGRRKNFYRDPVEDGLILTKFL